MIFNCLNFPCYSIVPDSSTTQESELFSWPSPSTLPCNGSQSHNERHLVVYAEIRQSTHSDDSVCGNETAREWKKDGEYFALKFEFGVDIVHQVGVWAGVEDDEENYPSEEDNATN